MTSALRIGSTHQTAFTVEQSHTISFPGLPPVLATPWVVWFVEHAALELLGQHLPSGEISVGTHIDLEHLAPALMGADVTCRARIINIDGPTVTFQVEARDGSDTLTRGLHRRRIVQTARLAKRLARKG